MKQLRDYPNEYKNQILKLRNQDNALIIAKYLLSMKHEINPSDNYRKSTIKTLASLSNFNTIIPFHRLLEMIFYHS